VATGRLDQLAQSIAARVVSLVLDAIDINGILDKIDLESLMNRIDIDELVERVDIEAVVDRVDIDGIVNRIDIDSIVNRIDIDSIVNRVDIDAIVGRVDIDAIANRIDIDRLLQHVDINAIVKRVDINGIVDEIDVDALVRKTELGSIIAKSTTGILTEVLDVVRSQGVGLDDFLARWTNRLLRRHDGETQLGPPLLVAADDTEDGASGQAGGKGLEHEETDEPIGSAPSPELIVKRQGQYAGAVSRLVAFALDVGAGWGLFVVGFAILSYTVQVLTGHNLSKDHPLVATVLYVIWTFVYFAYQWSLNGKTIGMAILGLQVVQADGRGITPRDAVIRTLSFPLGVLTLGIGFLGILTDRQRRAIYDRLAGTVVVYAWDARAARLRWLARQRPAQRRSSVAKKTATESQTP